LRESEYNCPQIEQTHGLGVDPRDVTRASPLEFVIQGWIKARKRVGLALNF
jgi:hypothetical protein